MSAVLEVVATVNAIAVAVVVAAAVVVGSVDGDAEFCPTGFGALKTGTDGRTEEGKEREVGCE